VKPATVSNPSGSLFTRQGYEALRQNRLAEAREAFENALTIDRDCVEAHLALARLRFPGAVYTDLLSRLHHALQPRTYVEIGVGSGSSMACAIPGTRCIGIDPAPTLNTKFSATCQVFFKTSDAFFADHDLREILEGWPVELGFIDGLHLFENVLADFANLERYTAPGSTILIHDCVPLSELTSSRTRRTRFWTGDVWRILPVLAKFRPDLSITVVECPPSGLAIVRRLDPASTVLTERRQEALSYGLALNFSIVETIPGLRIIANTWGEVFSSLSAT